MRQIDFDDVVAAWTAAGGKNTAGILDWFRPPVTTAWHEHAIRADDVGDLRFIGGDPGNVWEASSRGSYKVKDAEPPVTAGFRWDPAWRIVTIRDPESGARTIIDGNGRARRLHAAVRNGQIPADTDVRLMCGELALIIVRIAKSASSLWR